MILFSKFDMIIYDHKYSVIPNKYIVTSFVRSVVITKLGDPFPIDFWFYEFVIPESDCWTPTPNDYLSSVRPLLI